MAKMKRLATTVLLIAAIVMGCQRTGSIDLSRQEADRIVRTYLEARRDATHLGLLDQIFDPAVVVHDCSAPEDIRGLEALKSYYTGSHTGLPDFKIEIDEFLVSGDRLISRWTVSGTHTGDLRGLPPTGRPFASPAWPSTAWSMGALSRSGWTSMCST